MYEDKKFVAKKINWFAVILKLLLLILLILLISYLIYLFKNNNSNNKVKGKSMDDNLQTLKQEYIKYFDEENLPKYENQRVKVSLDELIENKQIKGIYDKNGNECSTQSSYGQITKIDNYYYNLKVYLKCKNEADSILTTISKDTLLNSKVEKKNNKKTNNNNNNNTNNNNTNTNTNNNNNTNTNTNTNNTNSNTNNNTNSTSTNTTQKSNSGTTTTKNTSKSNSGAVKTSSSSSSSSSRSSSSSSYTKTSSSSSSSSSSSYSTTTTTVTIKEGTSQTGTSTSSSTSSQTSTSTTNEIDANKIMNDPNNYLYTEYKMVKYGEASTTKPTSGEYETYTYKIVYNRYCYNQDMYNCDKIAKVPEYEDEINSALIRGAKEIYDHTDYVTVYIKIIDTKWSRTNTLEGYEYTGTYKDIYKTK